MFRIYENNERKRDKSSDSKKKKTPKYKEYRDQTNNSSPDKIKPDCYDLESTSNNYKYIKKTKVHYFNKHSASQRIRFLAFV